MSEKDPSLGLSANPYTAGKVGVRALKSLQRTQGSLQGGGVGSMLSPKSPSSTQGFIG